MASQDGGQRREVSIGEYDALSGLTFITVQRGRLMFNMGVPSTKRAPQEHQEKLENTVEESENVVHHATSDAKSARPEPAIRVFRSGKFAGRTLYPEEALFLVEQRALVVFALEEIIADDEVTPTTAPPDDREPLLLSRLLASMTLRQHISLPVLDVYTFLKNSKLHPRRYPRPTPSSPFMLNVFKSVTETQFIPVPPSTPTPAPTPTEQILPTEAAEDRLSMVAPPVQMKKRKLKRLKLIFRTLAYSFTDAMPTSRELRRLLDHSGAGDGSDSISESVPIKIAVAGPDRSVVLFEVD